MDEIVMPHTRGDEALEIRQQTVSRTIVSIDGDRFLNSHRVDDETATVVLTNAGRTSEARTNDLSPTGLEHALAQARLGLDGCQFDGMPSPFTVRADRTRSAAQGTQPYAAFLRSLAEEAADVVRAAVKQSTVEQQLTWSDGMAHRSSWTGTWASLQVAHQDRRHAESVMVGADGLDLAAAAHNCRSTAVPTAEVLAAGMRTLLHECRTHAQRSPLSRLGAGPVLLESRPSAALLAAVGQLLARSAGRVAAQNDGRPLGADGLDLLDHARCAQGTTPFDGTDSALSRHDVQLMRDGRVTCVSTRPKPRNVMLHHRSAKSPWDLLSGERRGFRVVSLNGLEAGVDDEALTVKAVADIVPVERGEATSGHRRTPVSFTIPGLLTGVRAVADAGRYHYSPALGTPMLVAEGVLTWASSASPAR